MTRTITYTIEESFHGNTILQFLKKHLYTDKAIIALKKTPEGILLNDTWAYVNQKISSGDILTIKIVETDSSENIVPENLNIDIIYEDSNYLVVNKPSGMLTISTDKEKNRTLYHLVREYIHSKKTNEKIFIVHRLDRETSGLVLFCKNEELRNKMQENWEKVAVRREYVAVVNGIIEKKKARLQSYLKENKANLVYISNSKEGKLAITNYEVIKENKNSLLKVLIETGRKNQIRVQLNEIGHSIIGDKKYGNIKGKRLLLCANRLDIKDLKTNKILSFEINIPREFMRNL